MTAHRPGPLTIGMLTTGYPHAGDPVAGAFVRAMARALAARGHALRVLCAARPGDTPVRDPGVHVQPVRYLPARTFYGAGAPDKLAGASASALRAWTGGAVFIAALAAGALRQLADCDALVSHFVLPCGLVAGLVRAGRPHLAVVHGTDGWWLARCPRWFQRRVLGGATSVQFTHSVLRDALAAGVPPGMPVVVRPMGVDVPSFPREHRAGTGELTAAMVSRLVPVKGVARAVDAVMTLRARGLPVRLIVAGDGPERGALETMAARSPGAVRFLGAVGPAARDALLASADVFLHTAGGAPGERTEGAPVAVLEAMASGLPVVALDAGGVRELVGDAGVVTDAGGIADALAGVASDVALRAALGARARARAWPLRWEAEAARIEGVLRADDGGARGG